jgi:hypothetical protein
MDIHKNARLTPHGRERLAKMIVSGQTPQAASEAVGVCPCTGRKWADRFRQEGLAGYRIAARGCAGLGIGIEDDRRAHDEHAKLAFDVGRRDAHLEAPAIHPHILHPRPSSVPLSWQAATMNTTSTAAQTAWQRFFI